VATYKVLPQMESVGELIRFGRKAYQLAKFHNLRWTNEGFEQSGRLAERTAKTRNEMGLVPMSNLV
jgi:hypothetical protein